MSKELTEKWKNGELIFGKTYWCSDDEGNISKLVLVSDTDFAEWRLASEVTNYVKEVLAPVPSYEEFQRLQEQLNEANEIIKKFYWKDRGESSSYIKKWGVK